MLMTALDPDEPPSRRLVEWTDPSRREGEYTTGQDILGRIFPGPEVKPANMEFTLV